MKLVLSEDYPSSPPRGYFLTRIYHPNIASNGDICVNTLKRDWTPEVTFKHILQVIRCLLIVPFPESSLNDEAGKLFMESYEEFARRARIMTEVKMFTSNSKL
jgi:ubiquitin-conjugating enzyme E2 S